MNIFKILSRGDGRLHEPNVSAFLGYLLDPNEDHGLGSLFLSHILLQHSNNNPDDEYLKDFINVDEDKGYEVNMSPTSDFRIDIFLEQAFKSIVDDTEKKPGEKKIVDIVLFIYKIAYGKIKKNETQILNQIISKKELKHIILIEIKTKDTSSTPDENDNNQLINQIRLSESVLRKIKKENGKDLAINFNESALDKISMIFIAPDDENSNELYSNLKKAENNKNPKSFLKWKKSNSNTDTLEINDSDEEEKIIIENEIITNNPEVLTIQDILYNIIEDKFQQKREAIPHYTTQTLQSFATFIQSDFTASYKNKVIPKREYIIDPKLIKEQMLEKFSSHLEKFSKIISIIKALNEDIELRCYYTIENNRKKYGDNVGFWYKGKRILLIDLKKNKYNFILAREGKNADIIKYGNLAENFENGQQSGFNYFQITNAQSLTEKDLMKYLKISYDNIFAITNAK